MRIALLLVALLSGLACSPLGFGYVSVAQDDTDAPATVAFRLSAPGSWLKDAPPAGSKAAGDSDTLQFGQAETIDVLAMLRTNPDLTRSLAAAELHADAQALSSAGNARMALLAVKAALAQEFVPFINDTWHGGPQSQGLEPVAVGSDPESVTRMLVLLAQACVQLGRVSPSLGDLEAAYAAVKLARVVQLGAGKGAVSTRAHISGRLPPATSQQDLQRTGGAVMAALANYLVTIPPATLDNMVQHAIEQGAAGASGGGAACPGQCGAACPGQCGAACPGQCGAACPAQSGAACPGQSNGMREQLTTVVRSMRVPLEVVCSGSAPHAPCRLRPGIDPHLSSLPVPDDVALVVWRLLHEVLQLESLTEPSPGACRGCKFFTNRSVHKDLFGVADQDTYDDFVVDKALQQLDRLARGGGQRSFGLVAQHTDVLFRMHVWQLPQQADGQPTLGVCLTPDEDGGEEPGGTCSAFGVVSQWAAPVGEGAGGGSGQQGIGAGPLQGGQLAGGGGDDEQQAAGGGNGQQYDSFFRYPSADPSLRVTSLTASVSWLLGELEALLHLGIGAAAGGTAAVVGEGGGHQPAPTSQQRLSANGEYGWYGGQHRQASASLDAGVWQRRGRRPERSRLHTALLLAATLVLGASGMYLMLRRSSRAGRSATRAGRQRDALRRQLAAQHLKEAVASGDIPRLEGSINEAEEVGGVAKELLHRARQVLQVKHRKQQQSQAGSKQQQQQQQQNGSAAAVKQAGGGKSPGKHSQRKQRQQQPDKQQQSAPPGKAAQVTAAMYARPAAGAAPRVEGRQAKDGAQAQHEEEPRQANGAKGTPQGQRREEGHKEEERPPSLHTPASDAASRPVEQTALGGWLKGEQEEEEREAGDATGLPPRDSASEMDSPPGGSPFRPGSGVMEQALEQQQTPPTPQHEARAAKPAAAAAAPAAEAAGKQPAVGSKGQQQQQQQGEGQQVALEQLDDKRGGSCKRAGRRAAGSQVTPGTQQGVATRQQGAGLCKQDSAEEVLAAASRHQQRYAAAALGDKQPGYPPKPASAGGSAGSGGGGGGGGTPPGASHGTPPKPRARSAAAPTTGGGGGDGHRSAVPSVSPRAAKLALAAATTDSRARAPPRQLAPSASPRTPPSPAASAAAAASLASAPYRRAALGGSAPNKPAAAAAPAAAASSQPPSPDATSAQLPSPVPPAGLPPICAPLPAGYSVSGGDAAELQQLRATLFATGSQPPSPSQKAAADAAGPRDVAPSGSPCVPPPSASVPSSPRDAGIYSIAAAAFDPEIQWTPRGRPGGGASTDAAAAAATAVPASRMPVSAPALQQQQQGSPISPQQQQQQGSSPMTPQQQQAHVVAQIKQLQQQQLGEAQQQQLADLLRHMLAKATAGQAAQQQQAARNVQAGGLAAPSQQQQQAARNVQAGGHAAPSQQQLRELLALAQLSGMQQQQRPHLDASALRQGAAPRPQLTVDQLLMAVQLGVMQQQARTMAAVNSALASPQISSPAGMYPRAGVLPAGTAGQVPGGGIGGGGTSGTGTLPWFPQHSGGLQHGGGLQPSCSGAFGGPSQQQSSGGGGFGGMGLQPTLSGNYGLQMAGYADRLPSAASSGSPLLGGNTAAISSPPRWPSAASDELLAAVAAATAANSTGGLGSPGTTTTTTTTPASASSPGRGAVFDAVTSAPGTAMGTALGSEYGAPMPSDAWGAIGAGRGSASGGGGPTGGEEVGEEEGAHDDDGGSLLPAFLRDDLQE